MTTTTEPKVSIWDYAEIVDPDDATWAFLNALDSDDLRRELFPYVRGRMINCQRQVVRAVEDEVYGSGEGSATREVIRANLMERRLALISSTFALADGTRVEWLQATPGQHRERAEMQRRLAGKCLVDAKRHEEAASVIEEFGVTCLAEVPE